MLQLALPGVRVLTSSGTMPPPPPARHPTDAVPFAVTTLEGATGHQGPDPTLSGGTEKIPSRWAADQFPETAVR
jgi:hypothetical protein